MKSSLLTLLFISVFFWSNLAFAQGITRQIVTTPSTVVQKTDLQKIETNLTPVFEVKVNTWSAGKIEASQAVISYSIRINDTAQPMEHGVCFSNSSGPTISNPKTTAKGYSTYTLYGALSGLKPGVKYYVKAYLKLLNYPDKIYYGNEISFTTLTQTTK